uniref:Squamosa promoter binding n=1 Tax=Solanum tuberosum TaxID=4113 RepID=M1CWN9_SOLTU
METNKWEGKRSINEAEEEEDEHESVEEDSKRKRVLTLSGRKLAGEGSAHPSCQVDQCTANMADAKPYHRRHKENMFLVAKCRKSGVVVKFGHLRVILRVVV